MNSTTKRIVAAFRLAGEPGRRKLDGFLRYMAENRLDWQLQFVRIREDFNAEFVKSFAERGVDGVVYSLPDAKDGAALPVSGDLPVIRLRARSRRPSLGPPARRVVCRRNQRHLRTLPAGLCLWP